jgi:hypothetical protein
MQLLLVVVGKCLQGPSKEAHGFVFTFLIGVFTYYSLKTTSFNYGRCNLWQVISLIAVGAYSLIATLSFFHEPMNIAWFGALCGVWLILFLITYYL